MSQQQAQEKQQGDNNALLEAILENAEMGEKTLEQILPMTQPGLFCAELQRQHKFYHDMAGQAELCLTAAGAEPKGQSVLARVNTRLGITMKTLKDKSTRNLAQMLSQGSYQGVLDCRKCETDFADAAPGTKKLLAQLEDFQQQACTQLEQYL